MTTPLVLDCLEQAIWTRRCEGTRDLASLVHHTDAGSQYTSVAFTSRLAEAGIDPSVGSVGDAYDNALAESQIGLFKPSCSSARSLARPGPPRAGGRIQITPLCTGRRQQCALSPLTSVPHGADREPAPTTR